LKRSKDWGEKTLYVHMKKAEMRNTTGMWSELKMPVVLVLSFLILYP
jgi:hypothetical protein